MKKISFQNLTLAFIVSAAIFAPGTSLADNSGYGNWSGTYLGAHAGGMWSDFDNSARVPGPSGTDGSWLAGGQIGHNWQDENIVWGFEGDFSSFDTNSKQVGYEYKQNWDSTIRARLGYAMGSLMPYGTAGVGLTDSTSKVYGIDSKSNLDAGFAGGGGLEGLLTSDGKWTGRVEYLYVNVPKDDAHIAGTTIRGGSDNNMIRVGLNYKL